MGRKEQGRCGVGRHPQGPSMSHEPGEFHPQCSLLWTETTGISSSPKPFLAGRTSCYTPKFTPQHVGLLGRLQAPRPATQGPLLLTTDRHSVSADLPPTSRAELGRLPGLSVSVPTAAKSQARSPNRAALTSSPSEGQARSSLGH